MALSPAFYMIFDATAIAARQIHLGTVISHSRFTEQKAFLVDNEKRT